MVQRGCDPVLSEEGSGAGSDQLEPGARLPAARGEGAGVLQGARPARWQSGRSADGAPPAKDAKVSRLACCKERS